MSTHHPTFGRSSGIGSVFKSLTKSLKSPTSSKTPVLINPTVVGGGQDVQFLFSQLQSSTLSVRADAAAKLSKSLKKYPISSITEVWYLVRTLCHRENPSKYRRIALDLMDECIKKNDSSVAERLMFFKDIVQYMQIGNDVLDPEYDLFLHCMDTLTNNGKNIHDFCIYDHNKNMYSFIESTLNVFVNLGDNRDKELIPTIDFVAMCLDHNPRLFNESIISSIITKARDIGTIRTTTVEVTQHLLQLIRTILSQTILPFSSLSQVVEYLCFVYGLYSDSTLISLIKECISHLRNDLQLVIQTICDEITNPELQKHRSVSLSLNTSALNQCLGAIQIMADIWIQESAQESLELEYCFVNIVRASKISISYGVSLINTTFLRSIDKLCLKSNYEQNFGVSYNGSFSKVFPFQMWISSTSTSLFDVLKSLRMNSIQDISYLQSICYSLQYHYEHHDLPVRRERLVDFFMYHYQHLSDSSIEFVLNYFREEKLCTMLNPLWEENCSKILNYFYYNHEVATEVKILCLQVIKDAMGISDSIFKAESLNYDLILEIIKNGSRDTDEALVDYILGDVFPYVAYHMPTPVFKTLSDLLSGFFREGETPKSTKKQLEAYRSLVSISSISHTTATTNKSSVNGKTSVSEHFSQKLAESSVELLLAFAVKDGDKAEKCYNLLIMILKYALREERTDLLLTVSKCMIRIRVTNENYIYFTQPEEMIALSTSFHRYSAGENFEKTKAGEYKWVYPEVLPYIPEKYLDRPSGKLVLWKQASSIFPDEDVSPDLNDLANTINIAKWLDCVLEIMTEFFDWEIYSFIWAHFCPQLSNLRLFANCETQIIRLRVIICDQLTLNIPPKIELPVELFTKGDLQVVLVRTLSALLGYHHKFTKYDEDQLINALIYGLESWEKTAIPCANILTICCYELPLSIKKYLIVILTKLQVRMSGVYISTHLLEFLISLIYLPSLTSNFTIEEFKRVFGIAFKYIQYANDMKKRAQQAEVDSGNPEVEILQRHGVDATVEETPSTLFSAGPISPILIEYILNLSFKVISSWFLKIQMNERKKLSSFLIKNLVLCNQGSGQLDDKTLGLLDCIVRFTYSDFPLTIVHPQNSLGSNSSSESLSISHWIMGYSIISFETDVTNGDCSIRIRRPTGITKLFMRSEQAANYNSTTEVLNSSYYLLQFFNNLEKSTKPIPILEDSVLLRAMTVLDRIPTVQFHKIGIIYIAHGQSKEDEILLNKVGSKSYESFLENIGELVKLEGANKRIHVGGLDTENGMDGEYSRYWRDKTTQIIFHITTMMSNESSSSSNNDKLQVDMKKRHIGNNYVNIFFDESGLPSNFNLIKSQFNFLNIVISPHTSTVSSFEKPESVEKRKKSKGGVWEDRHLWEWNVDKKSYEMEEDDEEAEEEDEVEFFKVKTYRRSGVPGVFATCHFKLVSRNNLAILIRNLSITANEFANVWHAKSGYQSNWSQRVRQIQSLKEKTMKSHESLREEMHSEPFGGGIESRYEYLEDDPENEIYSLVEFNSYTC